MREARRFAAWMSGTVLLGITLAVSSPAIADPKTIDMKDGFPSEDLPLGDNFLVTLAADQGTTGAHGLFFEYARGIFGSKAGSEIDYCSQLTSVASPIFPEFRSASPGDTTLGRFFTALPGVANERWNDLKARPAFLLPSWRAPEKPADGAAPVPTLRVPKSSFFQRGSHYCFIVVEEKKRSRESTAVTDIVDRMTRTLAGCPIPEGPGADEAEAACRDAALVHVTAAKPNLSSKERDALRDNLGPALSLAASQRALVNVLEGLETSPVLTFPVAAGSAFADFFVATLGAKAPPECKPTGAEQLAELRMSGGDLEPVWKDPVTQKERAQRCKAGSIAIGKATLADFVALAQGGVLRSGKKVTFEDLKREALAGAVFKEPRTFVDGFVAVARGLQPVTAVLEDTAAAGAEAAAQTWATSVDRQWTLSADTHPDVANPGTLQVKVSDFARDLTDWSPARTKVTEIVASYELSAIDASVGLNPKTWVFSFLTPTVGYAMTSDDFGIPTLALSLYAFPNAADEPMWTTRSGNWRRVLSLELGIAPKTKTFGPDDRYSGPGGLPPLLLGVGLHVIPYLTLSGGAMFVDAKRSTLPDEEASLQALFYFGASVQTNIPDIVSALVSGKNTQGE